MFSQSYIFNFCIKCFFSLLVSSFLFFSFVCVLPFVAAVVVVVVNVIMLLPTYFFFTGCIQEAGEGGGGGGGTSLFCHSCTPLH